MFGFFKSIKQEFADLKAKFEALEAKVEAFFKITNTVGETKADLVQEDVKNIPQEQAPAPVAPAVTDEAPKQ